MSVPGGGAVFLSYRRDDASFPAAWLYNRLAQQFGPHNVFKDVDSIPLGEDFVQTITEAVQECDCLIAVIGRNWLTVLDEDGQRRIDDAGDFVRIEIQTALTRGVRVIPVLVDGARMPDEGELPT